MCAQTIYRSLICIGEHGRISLTVSAYRPHVECYQDLGINLDMRMCQVVLNNMPVLQYRQVFGHAGERGINVRLPNLFVDRKPLPHWSPSMADCKPAGLKCAIELDIIGGPAYLSWYELWGAAVAVVGMCVSNGGSGEARVPGKISTAIL